jgi:hypothetical protein
MAKQIVRVYKTDRKGAERALRIIEKQTVSHPNPDLAM